MQQLDQFEDAISKKIFRLEKWAKRLNIQIRSIEEDICILKSAQSNQTNSVKRKKIEQLTMFGT